MLSVFNQRHIEIIALEPKNECIEAQPGRWLLFDKCPTAPKAIKMRETEMPMPDGTGEYGRARQQGIFKSIRRNDEYSLSGIMNSN
jgi:hypothetical protein